MRTAEPHLLHDGLDPKYASVILRRYVEDTGDEIMCM